MDINHLLAGQQIALMQAESGERREAQLAHRERARCRADQVRAMRIKLGAYPTVTRST